MLRGHKAAEGWQPPVVEGGEVEGGGWRVVRWWVEGGEVVGGGW